MLKNITKNMKIYLLLFLFRLHLHKTPTLKVGFDKYIKLKL